MLTCFFNQGSSFYIPCCRQQDMYQEPFKQETEVLKVSENQKQIFQPIVTNSLVRFMKKLWLENLLSIFTDLPPLIATPSWLDWYFQPIAL